MVPILKEAANRLLAHADPAQTRVGSWNTISNAKFYISEGKMIVTRADGELLTLINKTANKWYNEATPVTP